MRGGYAGDSKDRAAGLRKPKTRLAFPSQVTEDLRALRSYLEGGSFGVASHFIKFFSVEGPFLVNQALMSSPTFFP